MKVYDATNQILGRMATSIAKNLIKGETVHVVNAEKAVIAGNPKFTIKNYLRKIEMGDPVHGPFFPKTPHGIVKRTIRGMIDYKKPSGRNAFKRLRVWIGVPDELKKREFIQVKNADANKLKTNCITIGELSLALGDKKRW